MVITRQLRRPALAGRRDLWRSLALTGPLRRPALAGGARSLAEFGPYMTAPATCPCWGRGLWRSLSITRLLRRPALAEGKVSGGVWPLLCAGLSPCHLSLVHELVCPAWLAAHLSLVLAAHPGQGARALPPSGKRLAGLRPAPASSRPELCGSPFHRGACRDRFQANACSARARPAVARIPRRAWRAMLCSGSDCSDFAAMLD